MKIKTFIYGMCFFFLIGCSGGDPITTAADESEEDDTSVDLGAVTNYSYLPLMTVEQFKEWNAAENENVFLTYGHTDLISLYTINPIDATTGAPSTGATATDFNILEDGIPVNPNVSFPLLQPILGNQIDLRTAILINTSSAMSMTAANQAAFINEIKAYVTAAKSSSVSHIKNQEFVVWGYSGDIVEETGGATAVEANVLTAIDAVSTKWTNGAYETIGANHTYDAIVRAIGRYVGKGEFETATDLILRDALTAEDNDLEEKVTPDSIVASNIVLFSAGYGSSDQFGEEFVKKALDSQYTLAYQLDIELQGRDTATEIVGKPLIYVVPDGESQDSIIAEKASSIVSTTISGGAYSFADEVVAAQINALNDKFVLSNQHVLRWASAIRTGEKHSLEVSSRTAEDKFGYVLTVDDYGIDGVITNSMPDPQVEITGANNEYIASNAISNTYDAATTYSNLISTFYPATRWTNQVFTSANYTWSYTPLNSMTENSDGSISISESATYPITLTLTNNGIVHDGATVSDDFILTIEASN